MLKFYLRQWYIYMIKKFKHGMILLIHETSDIENIHCRDKLKMFITQVISYSPYNYYQFIIIIINKLVYVHIKILFKIMILV